MDDNVYNLIFDFQHVIPQGSQPILPHHINILLVINYHLLLAAIVHWNGLDSLSAICLNPHPKNERAAFHIEKEFWGEWDIYSRESCVRATALI